MISERSHVTNTVLLLLLQCKHVLIGCQVECVTLPAMDIAGVEDRRCARDV